MTNHTQLSPIAVYEDARLAQRHAELLETRGISCQLAGREVPHELGLDAIAVAEIDLLVPEDQAEMAIQLLDALNLTPLSRPGEEGDTLTLIGAFLVMMGLLTSFAEIPNLAIEVGFLPYLIILIGATVFLQGLMINKGAFSLGEGK